MLLVLSAARLRTRPAIGGQGRPGWDDHHRATAGALHGALRAAGNTSNDIIVQTTGGTNAWAKFWMVTPSQGWAIGTSQNYNGNQFYLHDATFNEIRIMIQPDGGAIAFPLGNVGIGTTNPQAKLDVAGRTRTQSLEKGRDHIFIAPGSYFSSSLPINKPVFLKKWDTGDGLVQIR